MQCDVFVVYPSGDRDAAERVGGALREAGLRTVVGSWTFDRPTTNCKAVVLIATAEIHGVARTIDNVVYRNLPIFALRLERFDFRAKLGPHIPWRSFNVTEITGGFDDAVRDLTKRVHDYILPPQPKPPPKPYKELLRPPPPAAEADKPDAPESPQEVGSSQRKPSSRGKPSGRPEPSSQPKERHEPLRDPKPASSAKGKSFPRTRVLAEMNPVRGFFSYSRNDDDKKELSRLREEIQSEVRKLIGHSFVVLWQDTNDIRGGSDWEEAIRKGISSSVFFVPIVSPSSVKSDKCEFEYRAFRDREIALGRNDLIFPIVYIDVDELKREHIWKRIPRLSWIAKRHYESYERYRALSFDHPSVREFVMRFCRSVVGALKKTGDDANE